MEDASGTAGRKRTWLRSPWAVAGQGQTIHSTKASPVRRAPEGPEGTGGLRGAVPNEVRSPSLAGGRGLRRPEHPWSHKQPGPVTVSGPPPTAQPGPAGARNASGAKQHANRHNTNAPRHTKNRHPDRMSARGGARGIRTPDLLIANETRYQLRHSPKDSDSLAPWRSATQADHDRVRDATDRKSAGIRVSAPSR